MSEIEDQARTMFLAVLERPEDQWQTALEELCSGNTELKIRAQMLLDAHRAMGSVQGADDLTAEVVRSPVLEEAGRFIGPYKLLQQIGEGGFGVVYMAEQVKPVRRIVALKIIKAGMDTAQVIARFESERQALALMDHPNIAKVLDAGATQSGRPFFVMELVKGIPITEFCDRNQMKPEDRLGLFIDVCHAIQHAHHKGVIHRDIKPSNVLVTLHDGTPVVKVIDFGVAKATVQRLTERTLFTAFGQMIGTPAYMSPEQAEMSGLDIDTRSDIYSLGVLLYELLTGTTPLELNRLRQAGYAEMQRLIREEATPRPSTRLSSLKDSATVTAGNRGVEVKRLVNFLAGDLDCIVLKSLEKDRNRRYATPGNFAEDLTRYLRKEAILARPASTSYKLWMFTRRNRVAVLTAAVVAGAMVLGTTVATWQALRATRAESRAIQQKAIADRERKTALQREAEAVKNERLARKAEAAAKESDATTKDVLSFVENNIFAAARPPLQKGGLGREVTLRKALDAAEPNIARAFTTRPRVEAQLRKMLGDTYLTLDDASPGIAQMERAYALSKDHYGLDDPFTANVEGTLALNYVRRGRPAEGLELLEKSYRRRRELLGLDHLVTIRSIATLIMAYRETSRLEDARKLGEDLLKVRLAEEHIEGNANQILGLSQSYSVVGRTDEAVRIAETALPGLITRSGPDDPQVLLLQYNLSVWYLNIDQKGKAIQIREPAYERARKALGPSHFQALRILQNLTALLSFQGRYKDSVRLLEEALPVLRLEFGAAGQRVAPFVINLTYAYAGLGKYAESARVLEESIAAIPEKERIANGTLGSMFQNLADAYFTLNDQTNCDRTMDEWEKYTRSRNPAESLVLASHLVLMGQALIDMRQYAKGERFFREALKIREEKEPKGWRVDSAKMYVGACIAEQGRDSEAEPLLVTGYVSLRNRWRELISVQKKGLWRAESRLALLYGRTGRPEKGLEICRKEIDEVEKNMGTSSEDLVDAACRHSVAAQIHKTNPSEESARLADSEAEQAMALLRRAVSSGYSDHPTLKRDTDLYALRDRADFKALLTGLEPKP